MTYKQQSGFTHAQRPRTGVLITNLGTPQAPTAQALRPYLRQFLSDPRVVEYPRLLWWLILHGIVLNVRPRLAAKAYASIWTEAGSPLMVNTQAQASALTERFGDDVVLNFSMRYGSPSINSVIDKMLNQGVRRLLVVPLYPQYSGATAGSTFDAVTEDFRRRRWLPDLRFVSQYHDYPPFVQTCARHIAQYWEQHGRTERLLFSYHGIPRRYLSNGDPYHCQCLKTSRLIADLLDISDEEYLTTFQSRFGREEWLRPYTDASLRDLAGQGVRSVQIFCPGFAADCLETLEEIAVQNRALFENAGGKHFNYIPCLNASVPHIDALENLIRDNLQGWDLQIEEGDAAAQRLSRAMDLGAEQ